MTNSLACIREYFESAGSPKRTVGLGVSYGTAHHYQNDTALALTYECASVYLIIAGALRVTRTEGTAHYTAGQYMLSSVTRGTAAHTLAVASPVPHLALQFDFTVEDVVSTLLDMDVNFTNLALERSFLSVGYGRDDEDFIDVVSRIVRASSRGHVSNFMQVHFKRELIYHIVTGPHGNAFILDILKIRNAKEIYSTNDWIKTNFKSSFAVDDLAAQANMSVSSFHRKFKAAIGMGPLQCQKQLRLAEAKRLMLDQNYGVTRVALEVGYESLSQFSRDYRKMFGLSPQKDVRSVRSPDRHES